VVSILTVLFAFYLRQSLLVKKLFVKFQVVWFSITLNSKIKHKVMIFLILVFSFCTDLVILQKYKWNK